MSNRLESLKIKAKLLQKAKSKAGKPIQLKEAFEIIAKAAGFPSWREQKAAIEKTNFLGLAKSGPQIQVWFRDYEEARAHAQETGGYLIPHEKDFFVGDLDFLKSLGLTENDPDLKAVGSDWSKPGSDRALEVLIRKISNRNKV